MKKMVLNFGDELEIQLPNGKRVLILSQNTVNTVIFKDIYDEYPENYLWNEKYNGISKALPIAI